MQVVLQFIRRMQKKEIEIRLVDDDPKGNTVLCDAGAPNYEPADYDYRMINWQTVYNGNQKKFLKVLILEIPSAPDIPDAPSPPENTEEETAER